MRPLQAVASLITSLVSPRSELLLADIDADLTTAAGVRVQLDSMTAHKPRLQIIFKPDAEGWGPASVSLMGVSRFAGEVSQVVLGGAFMWGRSYGGWVGGFFVSLVCLFWIGRVLSHVGVAADTCWWGGMWLPCAATTC